jgi:inner membrane transporter RhtA
MMRVEEKLLPVMGNVCGPAGRFGKPGAALPGAAGVSIASPPMSAAHPMHKKTHLSGLAFALGAMVSVQLGAAFAVPVMLAHGSFGITAMRLVCAALAMLVLVRPKITGFTRAQWRGAILLGVTMAWMTLSFFEAVTLLPIGPAVTIDFLGPLAVSVVALQGWPRLTLPLLALAGVFAITYGPGGWLFSAAGIAYALASACGWAGYIVFTRHVGQIFSAQEGLCLSIVVAACCAVPAVLLVEQHGPSLAQLPAAAGLALLAPLLPFSLEMMALRRMDMGAFSILMSLEPAFGAILGYLVLSQTLSILQLGGICAVMVASFLAVYLSLGKTAAPPVLAAH